MNVREAIARRQSIRDFRPDPVPLEIVTEILTEAARAPSGSNLQPWRVHVVVGSARDRLVAAARAKLLDFPRGEPPEHPIHPVPMSPAEEQRYKRAAELMYSAAGIDRDDMVARARHFARNLEFFGASVGLIFTIPRRMQPGQWAGVGMYMQNVMLLALEHGLATCAQEVWALWGGLLRQTLNIGADEIIYSGMALGHPNLDSPINNLRSERAAAAEFISLHGAEGWQEAELAVGLTRQE